MVPCSRQSGLFEMRRSRRIIIRVGGCFICKEFILMDHLIRGCLAGRQREEKASREDDHDIATQKIHSVGPNIYTHPLADYCNDNMCWGNIQWHHPQTTSNYKWIMGTLLRDYFFLNDWIIQWKLFSANKLWQKRGRELIPNENWKSAANQPPWSSQMEAVWSGGSSGI